jgi:hypothetical protein
MITFNELGYVGRLGNQLWQVASTIGLAWRNNTNPMFPTSWMYRPYFNVPDEMFADGCIGTPAQNMPELSHIDPRTRIYLQDLSFIAPFSSEIRQFFSPSALAKEQLRVWEDTLSVHVRRGDNVYDPGVPDKHLYYPVPSVRYYLAAIEQFPEYDNVAIFTDDYAWCVEVLKPQIPRNVEVVYGVARPKEHEPDFLTAPVLDWIDLFGMVSCSAHVLSNSTLGWWGAWLAGDDRAVHPSPWYGPALPYVNSSLMMPASWQEMDAR